MNTTPNTTKPTPPNSAPSTSTAPKTDAAKLAEKSGAAGSTNKDGSACNTDKSDVKKTAA